VLLNKTNIKQYAIRTGLLISRSRYYRYFI